MKFKLGDVIASDTMKGVHFLLEKQHSQNIFDFKVVSATKGSCYLVGQVFERCNVLSYTYYLATPVHRGHPLTKIFA